MLPSDMINVHLHVLSSFVFNMIRIVLLLQGTVHAGNCNTTSIVNVQVYLAMAYPGFFQTGRLHIS